MPNLRLPNFLFCPLASQHHPTKEGRVPLTVSTEASPEQISGWVGIWDAAQDRTGMAVCCKHFNGVQIFNTKGGAWQWIPEICWAFSRRCTLSICNRIAVAARGHTILWLNWLRSATWFLRFLSWTGWKCFMSFKRVPSSLLTTWHHWQVWPCNWPTQIYSLEFESSSDTLT